MERLVAELVFQALPLRDITAVEHEPANSVLPSIIARHLQKTPAAVAMTQADFDASDLVRLAYLLMEEGQQRLQIVFMHHR